MSIKIRMVKYIIHNVKYDILKHFNWVRYVSIVFAWVVQYEKQTVELFAQYHLTF